MNRNGNLLRLGVFAAIALVIYKTTPILDLLNLLLILCIPVAFVVSLLEASGAAFGLITDSSLSDWIEAKTHSASQWLEEKRAQVLAHTELEDFEEAPTSV